MIICVCKHEDWLHTKKGCTVIENHDGRDVSTGKRCKCKRTRQQVLEAGKTIKPGSKYKEGDYAKLADFIMRGGKK